VSDPIPDDVAEDALAAWLATIPLSVTPEAITTEIPVAGQKSPLPTLAAVWPDQEWDTEQRHVAGMYGDRAVFDFGALRSSVDIVWRCTSEAVAKLARSEIRSHILLEASASGSVEGLVMLHLTGTFAGLTMPIRLMLTPGAHIIGPDMRETVRRSYWETRLRGQIEYPLWVLEPEPGTGTMDIVIDLEPGEEGPSPAFDLAPFNAEDYLEDPDE
jgi:hypothetical protein